MTGALRLKLLVLGVLIGAALAVATHLTVAAVRADHKRLMAIPEDTLFVPDPFAFRTGIPDIFDSDGPITEAELEFARQDLVRPAPDGEPSVVLINAGDGELLTSQQFQQRFVSSASAPPHVMYFVDNHVAVEHDSAGNERVRLLSRTEDFVLLLVAAEFGFTPDQPYEERSREIATAPAAERIAFLDRLYRGPFDPRIQPWLEHRGVPDRVIEHFWYDEILDEDRAERRVRTLRYRYSGGFGGSDDGATVVHPSWEDYELAYTKPDGTPAAHPVRAWDHKQTLWVYEPMLRTVDVNKLIRSGLTPETATYSDLHGWVPVGWLRSGDFDDVDPERYRRLQDALRPTSLLSDAVLALLQQELAEAEPEDRQ